MANVQARRNKDGTIISYSIRVHKGRDPVTGKQLKPYTTTWQVPEGWSEKRAEKEAQKQAAIFEQQCREGFALDNRQTFAAYAEYVMKLKESMGVKHLTLIRYRQDLERILPAIGHMKLSEIRPQHLNQLYEQLAQPCIRKNSERAVAKPLFREIAKERHIGRHMYGADGEKVNVVNAKQGCHLKLSTAERIAKTLDMPVKSLFSVTKDTAPLCAGSRRNCHLLISGILAQAEKELLIPFNPAHRATSPKPEVSDPNYFQMEDVGRILEALDKEPIKWRVMVQMLLVTGCRRGELLGLKWDKVDWENRQIRIDCTLLYSRQNGLYEDTPKTKSSLRFIKLPEETMRLLSEYRRWQMEERLRYGSKWQGAPYVFTSEEGGPMNPSMPGNWLNRFSKRHNLPHINPHAFRHTMTSVLFFNGVDTISISHRLGHSQVSTTTNVYSHVMEQAESRINDCVADVILSTKSVGKLPKENEKKSS